MTVEERVAAGAAYMDVVQPGWERHVDVGILNIGSCEFCVLGQVDPVNTVSHRRTAVWPGLWDGGFDTDKSWSRTDEGRAEAVALTDAWTSLIKERFSSGTLSDEG